VGSEVTKSLENQHIAGISRELPQGSMITSITGSWSAGSKTEQPAPDSSCAKWPSVTINPKQFDNGL